MTTDTELLQPKTNDRTDPSLKESLKECKRHDAKVALTVGLALLRSNLDRGEDYAADYLCGELVDSSYGMSLINQVAKSLEITNEWLREVVREVLRANGRTVAEDADVKPEFAAAKKCVAAYYATDDYIDLIQFAGKMFVAGGLSCEAKHACNL